jgi:thioester reductase-like protein
MSAQTSATNGSFDPRNDCPLPEDIRPAPARNVATRRVLLTGATGFVGRHVLATLLRDTDLSIVCLVRGEDATAVRARIDAALDELGAPLPYDRSRIEALPADLASPQLGLSASVFDALAQRIDAIYHCGADVNWVKSYDKLRAANVLGTIELIRLAALHGAKPLLFVSTLAVCYAAGAPKVVDEVTDMSPYLAGMPLGYAQSKCVAEALLAQAAERGLPVSIVRAGLVSGDATTGRSNAQDMLSRLLRASITSGVAADVDWQLDCCAVDHVARVIVRMASMCDEPRLRRLHVHHPDPRHWREVVLWLNLLGYACRLVPLSDWFDRLAAASADSEPDLYGLRTFFLARPAALNGRSLPELYLEANRRRIRSDASRALLAAWQLRAPPLDLALMRRYFRGYLDAGFVRLPPGRTALPLSEVDERVHLARIERALRACGQPVNRIVPVALDGRQSILGELCAAKTGAAVGVRRYRAERAAREPLDLIVKTKPADSVLIEAGVTVAELCDPALGRLVRDATPRREVARSHLREIALYRSDDQRLRKYMPAVHAHGADEAQQLWMVVLEYLREVDFLADTNATDQWSQAHWHAAIDGLAEIHAFGWGRTDALLAEPWIAPNADGRAVLELAPWWEALARYSSRYFSEWLGSASMHEQLDRVARLDRWWPELCALPQTLIHNDFNPRNLAFRRDAGGPRLCTYDWELATLGAPQHDAAELFTFALPQAATHAWVEDLLERHRLALAAHTGDAMPRAEWRRGFALALDHLIVDRLPMYTLIQKFRPLAFLPRVLANWRRLAGWFAST